MLHAREQRIPENNCNTRLNVLTKYGAPSCEDTGNSQTTACTSMKRTLGSQHTMLAVKYSKTASGRHYSLYCTQVIIVTDRMFRNNQCLIRPFVILKSRSVLTFALTLVDMYGGVFVYYICGAHVGYTFCKNKLLVSYFKLGLDCFGLIFQNILNVVL